MFNAMARKGYEGTNSEDVPAMVSVHNWINEESWQKILQWESQYFPDNMEPHLVKFSGRPGKPTPKSYILTAMGYKPTAFDHHEWFVSRPEGGTRRYVIDYYGIGDDGLDFEIDVRPAVDDLSSLKARTMKFGNTMRDKLREKNERDAKIANDLVREKREGDAKDNK